MQRVLSSHLVVQQRLTISWLQKVLDAGIPAVEIFCARQHIDYRDKGQIRELGHWFRDSDLKLHSMHSPMYSDEYWGRSGPDAVITITETTKAERIRMVDEIKRAIEIAESIPFQYLIQHIGVLHEEFSEFKVEAAFTALEQLSLFARQRGVNILLENIPNELSTAARLQHFLKVTHLDLNFVFDTGHAHLGDGIEREFEIMKDRIRSLHIHDNDGKQDKHLFPMVAEGGTIDWPRTMDLLRSRRDQYPLLLELKESPDFPNPIEIVRDVFHRLENACLEDA
ncbi:MAG: Xylose isomerase domain protein barrel [Bryobacterales bacterium]|nr:Xylose isomerase domain protein barrel [Bryobacterales bacterium]